MDNKRQFEGLWAIILGGSSGFGFAAAEKLAQHAMNIAVLYREPAYAEKEALINFEKISTTNKVQVLPFNLNALDKEAQQKFIVHFSSVIHKKKCVRLLLHSIARGNLKPLFGDDENVLTANDIELTSYAMGINILDWTRLLMKENLFCNDASIIGLTSQGAHTYWPGYAAVSIAKSSLESLAKYMAVELAKHGLKTNVIQAGITETPSLKRIPGSDELIKYAKTMNPCGRSTQPQDVANVVYLLCTNEAAWINGALIHVDGGEHCL